jgi:hypothetical protein
MQSPAFPASHPITTSTLIERAWPSALLILGLGITVACTALLGYGFVALVEMAL